MFCARCTLESVFCAPQDTSKFAALHEHKSGTCDECQAGGKGSVCACASGYGDQDPTDSDDRLMSQRLRLCGGGKSEKFDTNIELKPADLASVLPGGCLTDNVVDLRRQFLDHEHDRPDVKTFSPFLLTKLCGARVDFSSPDPQRVRTWWKNRKGSGDLQMSILDYPVLVFPVNRRELFGGVGHWQVFVMTFDPGDIESCTVTCYDSFRDHTKPASSTEQQIAHAITAYAKDCFKLDFANDSRTPFSRMTIHIAHVPQQESGSNDCGVFTLGFIESLLQSNKDMFAMKHVYDRDRLRVFCDGWVFGDGCAHKLKHSRKRTAKADLNTGGNKRAGFWCTHCHQSVHERTFKAHILQFWDYHLGQWKDTKGNAPLVPDASPNLNILTVAELQRHFPSFFQGPESHTLTRIHMCMHSAQDKDLSIFKTQACRRFAHVIVSTDTQQHPDAWIPQSMGLSATTPPSAPTEHAGTFLTHVPFKLELAQCLDVA